MQSYLKVIQGADKKRENFLKREKTYFPHFVGGGLNTGTCVMELLTLRKSVILTSCYVGSGVVM